MKKKLKWFVSLITAGTLLLTAVPVFASDSSDLVPQDGTAVISSENPFENDPDYTKSTPDSETDLTGLIHGGAASSPVTSVTLQGIPYRQSEARTMLGMINGFRTSGTAWYWNEANTEKVSVSAPALVYDYGLEEIAMQRAAEIAASFNHTRPDGTLCFTAEASDGSRASGENIAVNGSASAESAFIQFREDDKTHSEQGHRINMLDSDWTAMGAACVKVNGLYFWVQEFGSSTSVAEQSALDGPKNVTVNISASRIEDMTDSSGNAVKAVAVYFPKTFCVYKGSERSVPDPVVDLLLKDAVPNASNYPDAAPDIIYRDTNASWTTADQAHATISGGTISGNSIGRTTMNAVVNVGGIDVSGQTDLLVTSGAKIPMYRLYNPNSGEHFYTKNASEKSTLVQVGWREEGIGWTAPEGSDKPVYRLYNPNAGDHHYTSDGEERDMLKKAGWLYEGIGWYSDYNETTPLYRQYNPNAVSGSHNYTTSKAENDYLASLGWREEGIGWYGL